MWKSNVHSWRIFFHVNTDRYWSWLEVHPIKCNFTVREQQGLEDKEQETEGHSTQTVPPSMGHSLTEAEYVGQSQGLLTGSIDGKHGKQWTRARVHPGSKKKWGQGQGQGWRQGTSIGLRILAGAKFPTE